MNVKGKDEIKVRFETEVELLQAISSLRTSNI
jgi:hypothetical protein